VSTAAELITVVVTIVGLGVGAQVLADRLKVPSVLFLVLAGIAVGPEFLGVIHPTAFGDALPAIVGLSVAAFVGYEWFVRGIGREALAVVAASGILLGVQLVIFGVLSDIIVTVNREQTRRLEELAQQLSDGPGGDGERRDTSGASIEAEAGSFDDTED
jgi:NhaP-type Na+/H+ or K+/H+ antiporter